MLVQSTSGKVDIANFKQKEVGKTLKSTKVEYIYEFFINGVMQTLKLVRSFRTEKIRIFLNGDMIHYEDKY